MLRKSAFTSLAVVLFVAFGGVLPVAARARQQMHGIAQIQRVDVDAATIEIVLNGQAHTVQVSKSVRVIGRDGRPLAAGLTSPEVSPGATVDVIAERGTNGTPIVVELRIAPPAAAGAAGRAGARVSPDPSGLVALPDLGSRQYQGYGGGLYPGGANHRPVAHDQAGIARAQQIQPLSAEGQPAAAGKIVLLSIGMSNTLQAFDGFMGAVERDSAINPRIVLVNGAEGGVTAGAMRDADDHATGTRYWTSVDAKLRTRGVTSAQVQAIWIKQADASPTSAFPAYAQTLQHELGDIVRIAARRFPNLKLAYLSSRTYGGFATSRLNPEPYAYESGFAVKWLIEQQLSGDPSLNFDPATGVVNAPWLSWGPYLWANPADGGATQEMPVAPGDFAQDGTHESATGQAKVGRLLLEFFKFDPTTRPWFVKTR
jgi:hypothetical protein